ncbi:hypothetical protein ANO11243_068810 [Dothideomycetidae sp. 11243]|nr:hypothetical protein ANO11243_068810 [fungal sp. No.11243]
MVATILCVAEKPSIAKAVANHLAGSNVQGRAAGNAAANGWLRNYEFDYVFPRWGSCHVIMTSVAGHLQSQDFDDRYRSWSSCQPDALFDAGINTYVPGDKKHIATNIERHARYAQALFIWTDCDREGEHIGTEIMKVAVAVNARLNEPGKVVRAKFSNIERLHIIQAAQNPIPLDEKQANAVSARIELDLRIGAAFTRMQTLNLRPMMQSIAEEIKVISYGSCQFPTLGFVVDRYFQVKNFVSEPFWYIQVSHLKDKINVSFTWARNRLFDRLTSVVLFERCLTAKRAELTRVQQKPASKWKPLPLTTVELQKMGSMYLRMDSRRVMQIAEDLYQKGFISYPRTETDQFDAGMDLKQLVNKQTQSPAWGQFAQSLIDGGYHTPRNGRNNDKAHPPIHPVNYVNPASLNPDDRRVHEFVVRRFLACCGEDAKGVRSEVELLWGGETFRASGLMVLERNYLEVYPYEKWTSTAELPKFEVGETIEPTEATLKEGKTTAPKYLTEPELIGLMDTNGIGTDATMAEHIAKIKERQYVSTQNVARSAGADDGNVEDSDVDERANTSGRGRGRGRGRARAGVNAARANNRSGRGVDQFIPTTLGVALYEGYERMGFETSLTKPFLRKEMELKMKDICEGRASRAQVVHDSLNMYREVYVRTTQRMDVLKMAFRRYLFSDEN